MVFIAMQEAMAEFDADQSGTIDFEEVCECVDWAQLMV